MRADVVDAARAADVRGLWAGVLAPAVAWGWHLCFGFVLTAQACEHDRFWPVHLLSAFCLLVAAGGGLLAWRHWRAVGGWPTGDEETTLGRVRLMAVVGTMGGLLFSAVILAQWVALLTLPCGVKIPT